MDSTKNFLDAWISTQSKLVNNLVDSSKKLQNSLTNQKTFEQTSELYENWMNQQQNMFGSVFNFVKDGLQIDAVSNFLKSWADTQLNIGKNIWEMAQGQFQNSQETSSPKSFFDWSLLQNTTQMQENWQKTFQQWFSTFKPPFNGANFNPAAFGNMQQWFSSSMEQARMAQIMYEVWQPFTHAFQGQSFDPATFYNHLDVNKYKAILESLFQPWSPNLSPLQGFVQQFIEGTMQGVGFDAKQMMQQWHKILGDPEMGGNLESLTLLSHHMLEQLNQAMLPYLTMMPASTEKEVLQASLAVQEKYLYYSLQNTHVQHLLRSHSVQSLEKVMKVLVNKAAENQQGMSFDEFLSLWIDTLEQDTILFYASDEFSRHQGKMLNLGLDLKLHIDKLMQLILAPLPLVSRTEMDEVNQTLHSLKRRVRDLEQQLKANDTKSEQTAKQVLTNVEPEQPAKKKQTQTLEVKNTPTASTAKRKTTPAKSNENTKA